MKLFGFRINAREIKDVREIEKTLENIEEKKKKIIDLAGQLSTLTEIKFKYSADGSIEKKFEVDGFEMDKILGNMRIAQMQIVASYKSLEALGMIEITPAPKNRGNILSELIIIRRILIPRIPTGGLSIRFSYQIVAFSNSPHVVARI